MQTVLVVEDEKLIRQGLSTMIKRCGVPVGEVIECPNGLKAMEVLREKEVDVLFTDIRMPKMNGIELVEAMQELENPPIVIAVSGYDDFSYAVEMMRGGAREYILKPVERDKLKEVMEKLEAEISEKISREKITQKLGKQFLKYILTDSDENGTNEENLAALGKNIKTEVGDEFYVLVSCRNDDVQKELESLSPIAEIDGGEVYIIGGNIHERILRQIPDCDEGFSSTAGISDVCTDTGNLKKAYLQAKERRERAFFAGNIVMDSEKNPVVPEKLMENGKKLCDKSALDIRVHLMGTDKISQIEKEWNSFFTAAERGQIRADDFAQAIALFINEFGTIYKHSFPEGLSSPFLYESIYEYKEAFLEAVFQENSKLSGDDAEGINDKKIAKALSYIRENYRSDINMAVVSNYVSMNYSLFSKEFKDYTGTNFVSYVRDLRIEEAKKLLAETELRINEIGAMVGYENDKHFLKNFKHAVGVSPGEYRRNIMA
ncbi:MAG: response regulator [Butyrivibrio sp.]|nr:response regulator [Butyrivibrio sp.]